ncbi:EexN family lipoprotein [Vibrio vulnificus]|uniref:EexN family lipoprotein n=1 Tax=Vibrio vulnificus TaxID=672 RepID=UPI004058738B
MKTTLLLSLSILLVGCGEATEPKHDVDYYKANAEARLEKLKWCQESPERKELHNCQKAHQANSKAKINNLFGDGISTTN